MNFEEEFPSLKDKHFRAEDPPGVIGFERYVISENCLDKQKVKKVIEKLWNDDKYKIVGLFHKDDLLDRLGLK